MRVKGKTTCPSCKADALKEMICFDRSNGDFYIRYKAECTSCGIGLLREEELEWDHLIERAFDRPSQAICPDCGGNVALRVLEREYILYLMDGNVRLKVELDCPRCGFDFICRLSAKPIIFIDEVRVKIPNGQPKEESG